MTANKDQRAFWTDQAGPIWARQMVAMDRALDPVLHLLLARAGLTTGAQILDVGCGAGTSTLAAAHAVGRDGAAQGVDISKTLLEAARRRAEGVGNVSFHLADAQTHAFAPETIDLILSRFGMMFFDTPVAAFANMARALRPDGTITFATWGPIPENPYFTLPARVAKEVVGSKPRSDPDAPGPFSMRDIDRVIRILRNAGLVDLEAEAVEMTLTPDGDSRAVADLMCEIGPAQSALDYFEADEATRLRLRDTLAEALEQYRTPDGIRLPAVVNFFSARKAA